MILLRVVFPIFLIVFLIISEMSIAQVENVPIDDPVYLFIKEMRVKGLIKDYDDGLSGLSRFQVVNYLKEVKNSKAKLSATEKSILERYLVNYDPSLINKKTSMSLFGGNYNMSKGFKDFFSDKQKFLFAYKSGTSNIFMSALGHLGYNNRFKPDSKPNAKLFDVGFEMRGTLFEKLGYYFYVLKGGVAGDTVLAELMLPQLRYNFKYLENIENVKNYDFARGYLKYYFEPTEGMGISAQFGREKVKLGYGYSNSLILSGNAPDMDFLKLSFKYGIINYYSFFGSGVGPFSPDRSENYTKYFSSNRLMLSFENLFDIGIGEAIVSTDRIELGYLNPVIFYKFVEMSLQDRDNGTIYFDLQTHFLKDLQFQGTFFLDENILSNLSDMSKSSNKTAYQLGFFWYRPVSIDNLSLIFEYTKIRPYVYTHFSTKNNYTSFGQIIGHPVGPNADQLFVEAAVNLTEKLRMNLGFQKIRRGENIYAADGTLERNVGGDVFQTFRVGVDPDQSYFLDGIRLNNNIYTLSLSYEPIRDFRFDLQYSYVTENNLTTSQFSDYSYGYGKLAILF